MTQNLLVETLAVGSLQSNCYLVRPVESTDVMIVDPGGEPQRIIAAVEKDELHPVLIVNTHGHADHIAANRPLKQRFTDAELCASRADHAMMRDPLKNLSMLVGLPFRSPEPDLLVDEGDELRIDSIVLRVIQISGHTPGGICLYCDSLPQEDPVLFSGDVLFAEGVGRTDFPGGNLDSLLDGIREKLFSLPDATRVYPGHGPSTTIGWEKTHNPFL